MCDKRQAATRTRPGRWQEVKTCEIKMRDEQRRRGYFERKNQAERLSAACNCYHHYH